jgi:exopolysaccharide biosynthesis polyprenyl glycosylphosphotransferase
MKPSHVTDRKAGATGVVASAEPVKPSPLCRPPVLWLVDVLALGSALYLGYWLRVGSGLFGTSFEPSPMRLIPLVGISIGWTAIFAAQGLYRRAKVMSGLDQVLSIGKSTTLGFLLLLALSFVWKRNYFVETRLVVAFGWIFSIVLPSAVRVGIIRTILRRKVKHGRGAKRAVVVGPIPFARRFIEDALPATNGYQVVGFVETREGEIASDLGPEYVLGRVNSLDDIVSAHSVEEIFLPIALLENRGCFDIVSRCSRTGLPVRLVSDIFEILMPDESKEKVEGLPPIGLGEPALKGVGLIAKRFMDLSVSVLAVVVFAPLLLLIAVSVKLSSPGPVLFRQIRAGRDGTPFTFFKFRTMKHNIDDTIHREYATNFIGGKELRLRDEKKDEKIYKMPDDPRITQIGRILRRTSLDELPQLFNVVKGDMSLVGPRPPIAYELTIYKEWHKRRLRAKPGITGLWQVSGRSSVPFHDMVLLDIYYINRWSLPLDIEIILKTVPVVLSGKGAY